MTSYLNEQLRVSISDGRVFIGALICFDNHKNIILKDCSEFAKKTIKLKSGDKERELTRYLGLVLIPGQHIVRCQVYVRPPIITEETALTKELENGMQALKT